MNGGKTFLIGLAAVLVGVFLWGGCAFGADSAVVGEDLQTALTSASPTEEIPIIVRMTDQVNVRQFSVTARARGPARRRARAALIQRLRQKAETSQGPLREMLRGMGKAGPKNLWLINALALKADPAQIAAISRFSGVASVTLDAVIQAPTVVPEAVSVPVTANVEAVHAPDLWAMGFTGQGVVVAILDTGVDVNHADLQSTWRAGSDSWFDPYNSPPTTVPYDVPDQTISLADFGHGTAVAGVLVGGSASGTAIGVAPGAQWIAAKIFDDTGFGNLSKIHAAFQWALDPDGDPNTDDAPDIVNNSWGLQQTGVCITDSSIYDFQPDIQALKAAGIAVVFAAGNDGPTPSTSESPANYPQSVSVGAVDQNDQIASFSSRGPSACGGGPYPALVAPGLHIETTGLNDSYVLAAGTSFAAPHVAGVMALLLNAFSTNPPTEGELESTLEQSATDLGSPAADNVYGYGLVDALAAYDLLSGIPRLSVYDSAPPENDRTLAFGSVPPGKSLEKTIRLTNVGGGSLSISAISQVSAPFSLTADGCSDHSLTAGETCTVSVLFSPSAHVHYADSLTLPTDDPAQPTTVVNVTGAGNSPPDVPLLATPAGGATGLAVPVTVSWVHPDDPDGDPVTDSVLVSKTTDFSNSTPLIAATFRPGNRVLFCGVGGGVLFLGLLMIGKGRRKLPILALVLALMAGSLLWSCGGGGGGGGGGGNPVQGNASLVLTNLNPATTYYWKVVSQDSFGATSQSAVRKFTTQ